MNDQQVARLSAQWSGWAALALLLAAIAPYSSEALQSSGTARAARQSAQTIENKDKARESMAAIARARIQSGCVPMLVQGEQVLIRPGMRGRDGVTGLPMAPGLVVCDHLGNTAITDAEGFFVDFAATQTETKPKSIRGDVES